jgi:phage tail-like protein
MIATQSQEFQFFILNTKASWEQGEKKGTEISDAGLILKSEKQLVRENRIGEDLFGQEVDFTAGDCDLFYLADATKKQIWIYDALQGQLERAYKITEDLSKPTNIAYSRSIIYIVDVVRFKNISIKLWLLLLELDFIAGILFLNESHSTLYAFGRNSWKCRGQQGFNYHIIDLVADRSGNAYVLFGDGDTLVKKCHIEGNQLQDSDVMARENIQNIQQPIAIALQEDNQKNVYVLDSTKIFRFNLDSSSSETINLNEISKAQGLSVDSLGNIYIGDKTESRAQEERFIYRLFKFEGNWQSEPVFGYRGSVKKLVIDPNGNRLYVLNQRKREVIILRLKKQFLGGILCNSSEQINQSITNCFSPEDSYCNPPRGRYYSQAFDSNQIQMRWHRLVLESEIPDNTRIEISYVTSDRQEQIDAQIIAALSGNDLIDWSTPIINPTDALLINQTDNIESPSGRYLWLKIELIGTQEKSPIIKSIEIYFPRLSYLRYLPTTYQKDEQSRDFLERFLALFETSLLGIEWQIDRIARYFDPDSTGGTGEFLRYLATWLAIAAENNWEESQLRQLVKAAPKLYRQRGTKAGLELLVQIFTGDRPIILEYPEKASPTEKGEQTKVEIEQLKIFTQLCGNDPFCFCILLSSCQVRTDEHEQIIKRLIDREKPAHTKAVVYTFKPLYRLGDEPLYLGINSYIARDNLPRLEQGTALCLERETALSRCTILIDEDDIERFR